MMKTAIHCNVRIVCKCFCGSFTCRIY